MLNANGEVTLTNGGTFVITAAATPPTTWTGAAGAAAGEAVITGITANAAGATVNGLIHQLTGNLDILGTANIQVTVQADGEVEVTSP